MVLATTICVCPASSRRTVLHSFTFRFAHVKTLLCPFIQDALHHHAIRQPRLVAHL